MAIDCLFHMTVEPHISQGPLKSQLLCERERNFLFKPLLLQQNQYPNRSISYTSMSGGYFAKGTFL